MKRLMAVCVVVIACAVLARANAVKTPWLESGETLVCYGDSITALPGYFEIVSNRLAVAGVKVINAGRAGDNSVTALMRIDEVVERKPDAVMIFFGTNDSAAGVAGGLVMV